MFILHLNDPLLKFIVNPPRALNPTCIKPSSALITFHMYMWSSKWDRETALGMRNRAAQHMKKKLHEVQLIECVQNVKKYWKFLLRVLFFLGHSLANIANLISAQLKSPAAVALVQMLCVIFFSLLTLRALQEKKSVISNFLIVIVSFFVLHCIPLWLFMIYLWNLCLHLSTITIVGHSIDVCVYIFHYDHWTSVCRFFFLFHLFSRVARIGWEWGE